MENSKKAGNAQEQHRRKSAMGEKCTFQGCTRTFSRECDLKKHTKRHTRPYGCTFSKCGKAFGSKNDWKRHENSQHFQPEMWRCRVGGENDLNRACADIFWHLEAFQEHLDEKHRSLSREQVKDEIRFSRIGRNGQSRFWCGFCRDIKALNNRGVQAWDERFNHIDGHFKKDQRIQDWICAENKKPKGELAAMADKNNYADSDPAMLHHNDHRDDDGNSDDNDSSSDPSSNEGSDIVGPSARARQPPPPSMMMMPAPMAASSRKRPHPPETAVGHEQLRTGKDVVVYCVRPASFPPALKPLHQMTRSL